MIKEVWYDEDWDTKQVDINGRTVQKINKNDRIHTIIDENGNSTRKEYDEWENLIKVVYPDGATITYEYEHTYNKKIREVNEKGVVTEYEYDSAGNMAQKKEAVGSANERITEYTYDSDGNQLTIKILGDATTPEALTTMTYDANGNMTSITDPEENTAYFTYDIMGNVLTRTDPRNKVWTYTYDDMGRLISIKDPLNNLTQAFYDEVGNMIRKVEPEGREKLFYYDEHDNLIKTTDAAGNDSFFAYNTDNKLIQQTDSEGKVINYQYDNESRLIKTTDGNGNVIEMEYNGSELGCSSCAGNSDQPSSITYPTFSKEYMYDNRDRKTQEKDILSGSDSYSTYLDYDESGNLISKTDKEGKTTTYEYDSLNRLKKVIDPMNQATEYVYDARDNLISLKDANGNITRFEYDRNNRLTKEIRPMGEQTTYQYDVLGNLIQKLDAKNQKTEYVYDDAGRLEGVRYYDPVDPVNPVKVVSFTYDKVGNPKTYDDGTTSATYGYDNLYRKTSETVNYGSFSLAYGYTYYKNGLKKTFTGPDNITYGYLYDDNNQLAGVQIPNVGIISVNEYICNRPANMTLPGGSTKGYTYDPLMRIKDITAKDPGQNNVLSYQYDYDKMDNIVSKATEHGDYAYGYDDLYRLTTTDNPVQDDEVFTYDSVGNRLTSADTTGDWAYNQNNELGGYNNITYVYDDNGNTIQKTDNGVVTNYIYNIEDRLTEVRDGSGSLIASYYYDPFGRRLWKEVDGMKTYFVYADEGLIGEYDSSGAEIKTYSYKPNSTWTTDPLFMKEGGNYYFYQNDHLGTPQKMTEANGAVVWEATYESFGEADIDPSATVTNNLRFAGQYYDDETGLHYNWYRYYDTEIGRYFIADPIDLKGGINLFVYALNNPMNLIDPLGLFDFYYYKRWGGPGWTAGDWQSWDTMPEQLREDIRRQILEGWDLGSKYKPEDDQDTCYMYHDICCGDARMHCRKQEGCYNECLLPKKNKCDRDLVNCLIDIGIMGNALDEAQRIAAIPVFVLRPAVNNAIAENKKEGTTWLLRFELPF